MAKKKQNKDTKKLTANQKIFVDEYLKDRNGTRAYKVAYKSCKADETAWVNASKLLRNAKVQESVNAGLAEIKERNKIDQDFVINGILKNIKRCEQVAPVIDRQGQHVYVETPDGEKAPAYTYDAKNAIKGYELLGKHLKMFTDKQEVTGKDGGPIQTEDKAAAALMEKIFDATRDKRALPDAEGDTDK